VGERLATKARERVLSSQPSGVVGFNPVASARSVSDAARIMWYGRRAFNIRAVRASIE